MAKGSSGIKASGVSNIVFAPSTSDETADKLRQAADFKFSRTTITMKNENGKTMGMVRGVERVKDMGTGSKFFDTAQNFKKASDGVKITELHDYNLSMDNLYADGKKLYLFNPTHSDKFLQNAVNNKRDMSFFSNEMARNQKKNSLLKTLESNGVIIINY